MVINGHEDNQQDILLRGIAAPLAKKTLLVDFQPIPDSKIKALSAEFNILLNHTVEELDDGAIRGLGAPLGMRGGGRGRRRLRP
jgi:protocatechuate 3,4-dioxygenase beta subunit